MKGSGISLVPSPYPALCRLQYRKAGLPLFRAEVTESWAGTGNKANLVYFSADYSGKPTKAISTSGCGLALLFSKINIYNICTEYELAM